MVGRGGALFSLPFILLRSFFGVGIVDLVEAFFGCILRRFRV